MTGLVNEQALQDWLGYQRRADLVRFLQEQKIDHWLTRGGRVVTTLRAIESRLMIEAEAEEFEFDG